MASWSELEREGGDLARLARERFDAHVHKTLATLRRDGAPRISGIELRFAEGEVWFGSMWGAVKARDLQRDPRFAIHSGSDDPADWMGDAKFSGVAVEITDPETVSRLNGSELGRSHLFRCDIAELSVVRLNESRDKLVIESWRAGRGTRLMER